MMREANRVEDGIDADFGLLMANRREYTLIFRKCESTTVEVAEGYP